MLTFLIVMTWIMGYLAVAAVTSGLVLRADRLRCPKAVTYRYSINPHQYCHHAWKAFGVGSLWPVGWAPCLSLYIASRPTKEERRIASLQEIERLERELDLEPRRAER